MVRTAIQLGLGIGLLLILSSARIAAQSAGIAAANLQVAQHDSSNNTASVTVTTSLSVNDFRIRTGSNRGDYNVQIGDGFSDDSETGVIMASVAENGRDNSETNAPVIN